MIGQLVEDRRNENSTIDISLFSPLLHENNQPFISWTLFQTLHSNKLVSHNKTTNLKIKVCRRSKSINSS